MKFYQSLSFKLVLSFILTIIAIFWLFGASIGQSFYKNFRSQIQIHSQKYAQLLAQQIGSPPNLDLAESLSQELNLKIFVQGNGVNWASSNYPLVQLNDSIFNDEQEYFKHNQRRPKFKTTVDLPPYQITFIVKTNPKQVFLLPGFIGIIVIILLLFFYIRHIFRPLNTIKTGVNLFGSGKLDHKIKLNRKDELGQLAAEINLMTDDINNILESKRQLLLAISHELRSPLTRIKIALSLIDQNKQKQSIEEDIKEMEQLIKEILDTEYFNQRQHVLNKTLLNINNIIEQIVKTHQQTNLIELQLDKKLKSQLLDEVRIKFVVNNLLKNALNYRKQQSDKVSISTKFDEDVIKIIVADQGIGIEKQHLPHLTEQFYRTDPSRQRKTGGLGLGLFIVKMIINAHGGKLDIESEVNVGTTVTVSLPK